MSDVIHWPSQPFREARRHGIPVSRGTPPDVKAIVRQVVGEMSVESSSALCDAAEQIRTIAADHGFIFERRDAFVMVVRELAHAIFGEEP